MMSSQPAASSAPKPHSGGSVPVGWILLVVVGAVITLLSVAPLGGGGFLVWADATQKDADGFFTSPEGRLETTTHAITSDDIDLGADPTRDDTTVGLGDIVTLRLDVESTSESAVFVGIGPRTTCSGTCAASGGRRSTTCRSIRSPSATATPMVGHRPRRRATEDFWVASADGPGRQTFEWEPDGRRLDGRGHERRRQTRA